jgi:hypothetical protein
MTREIKKDARPLTVRTVLALLTAVPLGACFYSSHTTPVDPPVERGTVESGTWSKLPDAGMVSLGDRLFWVRRYVRGARERVDALPPSGLLPFPVDASWSKTQIFHDGNDSYSVFTSPKYYDGDIGAILDSQDRLATRSPFVQVRGVKKGRRWAGQQGQRFFVLPDTLIEAWGLRYGGRRGDDYIFEVVDSPNPNVTQITQSLQIPVKDAFSGFTVRGVRVKLLSDSGDGVIRYTLRDNRIENLDASQDQNQIPRPVR